MSFLSKPRAKKVLEPDNATELTDSRKIAESKESGIPGEFIQDPKDGVLRNFTDAQIKFIVALLLELRSMEDSRPEKQAILPLLNELTKKGEKEENARIERKERINDAEYFKKQKANNPFFDNPNNVLYEIITILNKASSTTSVKPVLHFCAQKLAEISRLYQCYVNPTNDKEIGDALTLSLRR